MSNISLIEALVHSEYDIMLACAAALLQNDAAAQDVVQETFLYAMQHAEDLTRHPAPGKWLMAVLKHKCIDSLRHQQRERSRIIPLEHDHYSEDGNDPADILSIREKWKAVRRELSGEEMYLVNRIVFEGASYGEAARELKIPPATCRKRMERIRKKLKTKFL